MEHKEIMRDKIMAMFLLGAIGDALGMPVEVLTKKEIQEPFGYIRDYLPARPDHKWCKGFVKGQWTDDTQLTLAIARAYIIEKSFTIEHVFLEHVKEMERSTAGWGGSTIESLKRIKGVYPNCNISEMGNPTGAGNGISMKIAPVGAVFAEEIENAAKSLEYCEYKEFVSKREDIYLDCIAEIAQMTHCTRMGIASGFAQVGAVLTCFDTYLDLGSVNNYFTAMVINAAEKGEAYLINDGMIDKLSERFKNLFQDDAYMKMTVDELLSATDGATCYVYNSLPFTYAMFLRNSYSIETLFETINAGCDTDTNGAMVGSLLGAYNGTKIIPKYLLDGLWNREEVEKTASDFCDSLGL